jgi:oligopeptidase B
MELQAPVADKISSKRKFGFVEGELRGTDESKLINPPIELEDNYNWLRDDTRKSEQVLSHIRKENEYTNHIINPHRELINTLYKETRSYTRETYDTFASFHNDKDTWKYFKKFKEGEEYPSHWRKKELVDGCIVEEELLNINKLAENKPQCDVETFDISPSHKYMTYGVDYDGSEKYEFVLVDLETRTTLSHTIPKLAYCSYFWAGDSMIYYFVGDESNRIYQLWLYQFDNGISQLVYEETNTDYNLCGGISANEEYIIISSGNYDSNWCKYIKWKSNPYEIYEFLPEIDKVKYGIEHHNGSWFVHTNKDAVNWQVLKLEQGIKSEWVNLVQFIPPIDSVHISGFSVYEKFFTFKTKVNGCVYLNVINPERTHVKVITHLENKHMEWDEYIGQDWKSIRSENVYTISSGFNSIYTTLKLNVLFSSMIHPTQLFDYDIQTLEWVKVYEQIVPNYNQELYTSKRIWIPQEGTRLGIPVSIVYRTDMLKSDQTNPLYLYGYGSYGMTINPSFDTKILPLLDRGYIYAIAHIRGGAFLGYDWYEDGRMEKKMNTFKDFICCAEYFRDSGIIDPNKIVIEGRSAGGLLIGVSVALRPDLYWVAIPGVPFVDVLNTMSDSNIPLTTEEWTQWGNPNELEWFNIMREYCPYSNIKSGSYPHMYCTSGLHDPRVPYWEILKLVAKIREHKTDINTQVIRVETTQGHFGGSSRYKSIEELAEKYAFVLTR